MSDRPKQIGLFFTRNFGALAQVTTACTIAAKEVGRWSDIATHAGLIFGFPDGTSVIFEALMDKGWSGPTSACGVTGWVAEDARRRLRVYDMTDVCGFSAEDVALRYEMAIDRRRVWIYSKAQLGLHFRTARVIRGILGRTFGRPSTGKVICSEAAAQFVNNPPFMDVLRECGVSDYDLIDPAMLERRVAVLGVRVV